MAINSISKNCVDLIKKFEGCKLTAYQDSVGVWTIGYGTTNSDKAITGIEIKKGTKITQTQADNYLSLSLNKKYLPRVLKYNDKYDFNQNQIDALVCFAYNIGSIAQLTNDGKRTKKEISEKILAYDKAGGKVLVGLTKRRKAEKQLFDTPVKNQNKLKQAKVNTQNLTIRNSRGVKIGSIAYGKYVTVVNEESTKMVIQGITYNMSKIQYGSISGYVAKKYLDF